MADTKAFDLVDLASEMLIDAMHELNAEEKLFPVFNKLIEAIVAMPDSMKVKYEVSSQEDLYKRPYLRNLNTGYLYEPGEECSQCSKTLTAVEVYTMQRYNQPHCDKIGNWIGNPNLRLRMYETTETRSRR